MDLKAVLTCSSLSGRYTLSRELQIPCRSRCIVTSLVSGFSVLDTAQFFFEVASFHWVLINCRKNTSLACSYYVPR